MDASELAGLDSADAETVCEALGRYEDTLRDAVREIHVDINVFKKGVERRMEDTLRLVSPLSRSVSELQQENRQLRAQLEALARQVDLLTGAACLGHTAGERNESTAPHSPRSPTSPGSSHSPCIPPPAPSCAASARFSSRATFAVSSKTNAISVLVSPLSRSVSELQQENRQLRAQLEALARQVDLLTGAACLGHTAGERNESTAPHSPRSPTSPGSSHSPCIPPPAPSCAASARFSSRATFAVSSKTNNIDIQNFSSSWNDGMAFCALVHSFFPEEFDYNTLNPANRKENFEMAFTKAEDLANCDRLIEVEDMLLMGRKPDPMCVFTYVQSLYNHLRRFE
ncbi:UNVERIFIED_CONTAM: hypothetical protein FKN15_064726 [Acipenser sinensis]